MADTSILHVSADRRIEKSIGLSLIIALGWMYSVIIFHNVFKLVQDYGVFFLLGGWFWAAIWAWLGMKKLSKGIFGAESQFGFWLIALGGMPLSSAIAAALMSGKHNYPDAPTIIFRKIFYFLSFGGLLVEPFEDAGSAYTCRFFIFWLLGFIGFVLSHRRLEVRPQP